jgi:hypothetical protein
MLILWHYLREYERYTYYDDTLCFFPLSFLLFFFAPPNLIDSCVQIELGFK